MTASAVLNGKHLRFVELEWAPFATFDAATNTWSGIDIDMLTELSSRLNFTYDIIPMVHITGDTWTTTLFNHLTQGDLIGCYWMNTRERRDRSYMLNGHVDSSIMLAVPPMEVEELTFWDRVETLHKPFTPMAWLAIGVTCIISGVGYYLLEGLDQGDEYPFESIYEQLNVLIYGENPGPKNAGARFNMPLGGIVQLVLTAAYTANLATFLLVRSQPTRSRQWCWRYHQPDFSDVQVR